MKIFEEALRLLEEGRSCALATIVESRGSAPQKAGAKMLVRDDGSLAGTLGGGCLEAEVRQAALMSLRDGEPRTLPVELTEDAGGLVCGGKVLVFVEPLRPDPTLLVLGAGHVGRAVAELGRFAGFRVTVIDDREEYLRDMPARAGKGRVVPSFAEAFSGIPVSENTYVVVATRGHLHDYETLKASLATGARYIGLLGSRRKRAMLFRRLRDDGFSEESVNRIMTPAGLSIGARTPQEIGVSIVAQIIETRRNGEPSGVRDYCGGGIVDAHGTAETTPSRSG